MHQRFKYVQVSFLSTFCHFSQQQKGTGKLFYECDDNGAFLFVCWGVCCFVVFCVWFFFFGGGGSALVKLIVLSDYHITGVPIPLTSVCTMRTLSRRKL